MKPNAVGIAALVAKGYQLDSVTGLYRRQDFKGIPYSDGDDHENYLLTVMREATDLSVLSPELVSKIKDWPSQYHLSPQRANILRPLQSHLSGDVLEIGAGCGAITRFLGECGANVIAVEGSLRRATIARARTKGLENVQICAESFAEFDVDLKFDVVTLVGVFEYASVFMGGVDAHRAMLKKIGKFLKPGGHLLIAIENQLGIRYLAGAYEDHVGIPMFGVEDRYTDKSVRTFGRKALVSLLQESGFDAVDVMGCYPDYKLPSFIITAEGAASDDFNGAGIAAQAVSKDQQAPVNFTFNPQMALSPIFSNRLGVDLASSFLVVAGRQSNGCVSPGTLGFYYGGFRRSDFSKLTEFVRDPEKNEIFVNRRPMSGAKSFESKTIGIGSEKLLFSPEESGESMVSGASLSSALVSTLATPGWSWKQLDLLFERYISALENMALPSSDGAKIAFDKLMLDGRYFDFIPSNLIVGPDSRIQFIDKEWQMMQPIPARRVLFRGILSLVLDISDAAPNEDQQLVCGLDIFHRAFACANENLSDSDFQTFLEAEIGIQERVSGVPQNPTAIVEYMKSKLRCRSDVRHRIFDLECQVESLHSHIRSIENSRKWRMAVSISRLIPKVFRR